MSKILNQISKNSEANSIFFIAEAGINHNGDIKTAMEMIDKAYDIGIPAIKFQTFKAESLLNTNYTAKETIDFFKKVEINETFIIQLNNYCKDKEIIFCATPFSYPEVDFLDSIHVPFFKIASMDLNNYPYLKYVAKKGKPIVLSTGYSSLEEIIQAVRSIFHEGNEQLILLHCVPNYPPKNDEYNLRFIEKMKNLFGLEIGYSDHSIGTHIPIASVALGAKVIEKHFTLDKLMEGPDQKVSADPKEFSEMMEKCNIISTALGDGDITKTSHINFNIQANMRRSIVAKQDINKDEVITIDKLDFKRPSLGLKPEAIDYILNRKASNLIQKNKAIDISDIY